MANAVPNIQQTASVVLERRMIDPQHAKIFTAQRSSGYEPHRTAPILKQKFQTHDGRHVTTCTITTKLLHKTNTTELCPPAVLLSFLLASTCIFENISRINLYSAYRPTYLLNFCCCLCKFVFRFFPHRFPDLRVSPPLHWCAVFVLVYLAETKKPAHMTPFILR